ncbi:MAG TPA: anthrone oxygenase family protein [Solirubrobacterales bacterium]|nr:anthrone oxygenase family protein [Solirubrobacterales bacterium]
MGCVTFILVLASALGCGLAAGVFFAFSTYVMPALGRLPAAQGIAAMQSINVVAPRPFVIAQVGTAAITIAASVAVLVDWDSAYGWCVLAAAFVYVLSIVVLTAVYHVPRNNALATVEPDDARGQELWSRYLVDWTRWNHFRALLPLVACGLEIAALLAG